MTPEPPLNIYLASLITAPPDNCYHCLNKTLANRTNTASNGELTGIYHCKTCRYIWKQTWRTETINGN